MLPINVNLLLFVSTLQYASLYCSSHLYVLESLEMMCLVLLCSTLGSAKKRSVDVTYGLNMGNYLGYRIGKC